MIAALGVENRISLALSLLSLTCFWYHSISYHLIQLGWDTLFSAKKMQQICRMLACRGYSICTFADVVSDFTSRLWLDLCTTTSWLPFHFPCCYLVVWPVLRVILIVDGKCCCHFYDSHRPTCFNVTWWFPGKRWNFSCSMRATQLIGIFLPPGAYKLTQLFRFDIINLFPLGSLNVSLSFPPESGPLPPTAFESRIIVWMGGLLAPDV